MREQEPPWTQCNRLMWNFPYGQRVSSWIWAAKNQKCPVCEEEPGHPCINMTDVHRAQQDQIPIEAIRQTKWPHSQRVDWDMLLNELVKRGYRPEPAARKAARLGLKARDR